VVIVIPGALVALIFGLRMRVLSTWAAIPALSLAAVFLLGEITMILRVPFGLPAFAVVVVLLFCVVAIVGARRSARRRARRDAQSVDAPPAPSTRWSRPHVEHGLLALGIAVGTSIWLRGLRGVPLIPPGGDATRHAWFVGRILFGHSIDPSKVLTSDAGGTHPIANYYPLALHASAALSTPLFGSYVGRVLVAYLVLFSAVVLPVGMFVLARTLAPARPLVAGFTALVVPLLMVFPYFSAVSGDVPQVIAMALVPVTVVLFRRAMLARRPRLALNRATVVALAPATLAILCITALHTSELPMVVMLALLLVIEQAWRDHDGRRLLPALLRGAAVGASATLLFAPTLVSFFGGVSERVSVRTFVVENPANWEPALGAILQLHIGPGTMRQGLLALLAVIGAALWLMRRRPAWVAGWAIVVLLGLFAAASTNRLADRLTFPWYHLQSRIVPNVAFFVPFFAATTLAAGVTLVTRALRRSWAILPATVAMIAFLTLFAGLRGFRGDRAYVRASFNSDTQSIYNQAFVGHTSLAAFRWLHDHVARSETVANQPLLDGSLWMYAQEHVAPLIGPYALSIKNPDRELVDRLYLVQHLPSLGRDPRADALAVRYRTRWIFLDAHASPFAKPVMNRAALLRNRRIKVVFHKGRTWVLQVDLAGLGGADPART